MENPCAVVMYYGENGAHAFYVPNRCCLEKTAHGFGKSVVILFSSFINFPHNILDIQDAGFVMDKHLIILGKLSCLCESVQISNFPTHIT